MRVWCGHNSAAAEYVVDPGATFVTPEQVWVWSTEGVGPLSRRLHRWVHAHATRDGDQLRPIVVNNWEATAFSFDTERLLGLIDHTADLGAELFLLDDGWFGDAHPRDDDTAGLGDWRVDETKLPGGLGPVIARAEERGVRFGLWVEPEMVNPDSTLYAEHPDWVVSQPTRRPRRWRHQLVLDVLQPDAAADFVCGVVDRVLAENPGISYLKWDANRPMTDPGSPTLGADRQANYWVDHARATWHLMETVAERHPEQTLMLCASGGGRVDLGSLRWFHEVWLSDNTDPVDRLRMQWAASQFLPANVVAAHVTREGDRPVAFGCAVAMSARFGFDLDFGLTDDEWAICRRAVELYRETPAARPAGGPLAVDPSERACRPGLRVRGRPTGCPLRLPAHHADERCGPASPWRARPGPDLRGRRGRSRSRPRPDSHRRGATTRRGAHGGGAGVAPVRALHRPHLDAPVPVGAMRNPRGSGQLPRWHDTVSDGRIIREHAINRGIGETEGTLIVADRTIDSVARGSGKHVEDHRLCNEAQR